MREKELGNFICMIHAGNIMWHYTKLRVCTEKEIAILQIVLDYATSLDYNMISFEILLG